MTRCLKIGLIFCSLQVWGQKFADVNYYLVDSLEYDNLSPEYQQLVNTSLSWYHQAETDIDRINAVNNIVKLCWDERVWPKYNYWVYEFTSEKLNEPQTDSVRTLMLQAYAGAVYYIGWNYYVASDYDKSLLYYTQCKDIYIEIGDSVGISNALDNIGNVYLAQGESAKALDYYKQALALRELLNYTLGMAASLTSIGSVYMEHGDYLNAYDQLKKSLSYYESANYVPGISSALNNLGFIEYYFGNHEGAMNYFQRSLTIKKQISDKPGEAISYTQIGLLYYHDGKYNEALHYFNKALIINHEIGSKRAVAGNLQNIGAVYLSQLKFKKAISYFNKSLTLAQQIGLVSEKRSALKSLFETHFIQGNFQEAEREIAEIIAMRLHDVNVNFVILPEQKKELYFNTMVDDFMDLYAFAEMRKNDHPAITALAYNNALVLKGLLLKSATAMRDAIHESGDAGLIEAYSNWIALKQQIANAYAKGSETENLEKSANELEQELIKKSTEFNDYHAADDIDWKDIQTRLQPNEAAIEFVHFNALNLNDSAVHYAAMIITPNSTYPEMVSLCSGQELEKTLGLVQTNNLMYVQNLYGTKQKPNQTLYQLIWKPLEEFLPETKTIFVSATGLIHKISLYALADEQNRLLCDKYNLVPLSSTAQLVTMDNYEFETSGTVTLFGGVKYSTQKTRHVLWNYLPGSLIETDSIHNGLNKIFTVNYFTDEKASEENFKKYASESKMIHIASHGFFYPDPDLVQKQTYHEEKEDNPDFRGGATGYGIWNFVSNRNPLMRSGIALAGANDMWNRSFFEEGEDGVLTAQEVATLNLRNTDLVVLSACETGLGDIRGSEGVYGLQRAFKMAGVRYLIMSLWQVPDAETAEFMMQFYANLMQLKDIRKAFHVTQKLMSQKYDPYYWAAFVLIE